MPETIATYLNALSAAARREALLRCCHSTRWVEKMQEWVPFESPEELQQRAIEIWQGLGEADFLEAFKGHPQIGASAEELRKKFQQTSAWSSNEQAGMQQASDDTIEALRACNAEYLAKFGYIFIVCATGKSAEEMLEIIVSRLPNAPEVELSIAAKEQEKITAIRLEKLL